MKSLINLAFKNAQKKNRPALISYTVCGDNNKKVSLDILKSISKNLDIVEWGVAHNCPTADGKEIQNSSYRALKSGIKLNDIFQMVKKYKKDRFSKPLILMGYYQMIFNFGEKKFIKKCKEAGVDGLIVVDLSYPDNKKFALLCKKNSICFVQLIAPTTSNKRMKEIIKISHEMIYMISMISTTGSALKVTTKKIMKNYKIIKKINPFKNVAIGFGITKKTIKALKKADGLVVGSAICKEIKNSISKRQNPVTNVTNMVIKLKNKIK
tara:strand:+ start:313 stop:1113 length:801 start_codon:yes stop_codon:yes gene_type:complete